MQTDNYLEFKFCICILHFHFEMHIVQTQLSITDAFRMMHKPEPNAIDRFIDLSKID